MNVTSLGLTKLQGLGNDFIVIDDVLAQTRTPLTAELARKMCDRRFGIGADQILWLKPAQKRGDFRMDILNADGSVAEMCGNGIRAAALYFHDRTKDQKQAYDVETLAGNKLCNIHGRQVEVDMGAPIITATPQMIEVNGKSLEFIEVSMGNPHAVFFTNEEIEKFGAAIEAHERFPQRTNVEFVKVMDPQTIQVKVWERGAGITLACGTGACASAVASLFTKQIAKSPVTVHLPGGALKISWSGDEKSPVLMEGPAEEVFSGQYPIAD